MPEVPIPFAGVSSKDVTTILDERGQVRLSELESELETTTDLGNTLLELIRRGEIAVFPNGEAVMVKPVT